MLFEANKEQRDGLKIAKYFTILETLSNNLNGRKPHQRVKELFEKYEFTQPYQPNRYKINFNNYHNKLDKYYLSKCNFSYMEIMTAYRNLVVHYGDIYPSIIINKFESRNELIDLLEFGVYMILKTIIKNNESF